MTDEPTPSALITTTGDDTLAAFEPALRATLAGKAPHTRRAYRARVRRFAAWRAAQPPADLLTHLEEYVEHLRAEGMAPRSVQAHLSTLKTLVRTAVVRYGDDEAFRRLPRLDTVSAPPVRGAHQGERLSRDQLQRLHQSASPKTSAGNNWPINASTMDCPLPVVTLT